MTTTTSAARAGAAAGSATAGAAVSAPAARAAAATDRDTELREDDVVQPVAGILDVLDNYAFVRTSGYLAGPNDVYVSMNMVRKNGLRRGDAVTGAVRVARKDGDGEQPATSGRSSTRWCAWTRVNGGPVDDGQEPSRVQQADPAVPEPAAAPGDHARDS